MRLDEWQKYLEGEFVDESDSADSVPLKVQQPSAASSSAPPTTAEAVTHADSWIPATTVFGAQPVLLAANVSVRTPLKTSVVHPPSSDMPGIAAANTSLSTKRATLRKSRAHSNLFAPSNVNQHESAAAVHPRAEIPKHINILLELGYNAKIQDHEVAQSSYKRPFKETRQELIERLLDPVLSLEEAARLLNVCPTTVRRYTIQGLLNYYRKEPEHSTQGAPLDKETRQRRFRLSDILAFLESQECAQVEP